MLKDLLRGVASKLVTVSFKGTQSDWTLHFMSVADIPRLHRWISTQRSDRFVLLKQHQHLSTSGKISCRVEQWSFRRHQKAAGSTICPFFNEAIFSKPKHAIETVTLAADRCHQDEGGLQIGILTQVSKTTGPFSMLNAELKKQPFWISYSLFRAPWPYRTFWLVVFGHSRHGHNRRKPGHFACGCWNGTKLDFQVTVLGEQESHFPSV